MTEGLLPCWKCGIQNAQLYTMNRGYYIVCSHCNTISPIFKSSLAAAKSWNDAYLDHKKENGYETK